MTAYEVLTGLGVTVGMVEEINGIVDEMPLGYQLKKLDIKTGRMLQAIKIYPNQKWTDGTVRPVYDGGWKSCEYNVTAYLNTRI